MNPPTSDDKHQPPPNSSATNPVDPNAEQPMTGRQTYNVVADTIVGPNIRKRDNILQAIFILAAIVVCAGVGAALAHFNPDWDLPWYGGALAGAIAGLVIGFFASGIFLMVYRAVKHSHGDHD